jgi:non-ribosomal peptide synthetase component F
LSIHDLLEPQAEMTPDAIAVAAPGRRHLTYRRLVRQVNEVVNALRSMGVGRNDRVAWRFPSIAATE